MAHPVNPAPDPRPLAYADQQLLLKLRTHFGRIAGSDLQIDAKEFQKAIGISSEYLATRIFDLFDRDGSGTVTVDEFIDRVQGLIFGSDRQKLRFAFRLHDHDGDGLISRQELDRIITMSLGEDRVNVKRERVQELVHAFYAKADVNRDGYISFPEFERVVTAHPEVLKQITKTEACWICPNEQLLSHLDDREVSGGRRLVNFFQDRGMEAVVITVWLLANAALFGFAVLKYQQKGAPWMVQLARGGGACLNFNGALILLPMMRRLLTWIRQTWLHKLLPVDESIGFHKLVAHAMWGFALLHTAMHFTNYALNTKSFVAALFMSKAGLTGFILLVVFATMWTCSLDFVRRRGKFELFYWTHMLYWAWFALCLVHGPVFWMWAGVPIAGYLLERVVRLARRTGKTEIIAGHPLRSGVTHLEIRRPPGWEHRAGDYLFLRIPGIAKHEWHPFTISGAPEKEAVSVHIRTLGNWTRAVREFFQERERIHDHSPVPCFIDGPYGTPSAKIFDCRNVVLVGAGIGVTPFASILQSILYRQMGKSNAASKLKKVHFVWLNKDQYSFEWFRGLLWGLEQQDHSNLLDIHICMTNGRVDISAAALGVAREIVHGETGKDLVTELRAKTHFGRPDWDELLGGILRQHAPEPVHVFFCGPEGLARVVKSHSRKLGMIFRQEHF